MNAIPCPRDGCTYKYHPTGPHSYQVDNPKTSAEWDVKGVEVAGELANRYRRQMYRLGWLPDQSEYDTPLPEWALTDKINMRDAAVGLISDLCRPLAVMGEGSRELVDQAVTRGYGSKLTKGG